MPSGCVEQKKDGGAPRRRESRKAHVATHHKIQETEERFAALGEVAKMVSLWLMHVAAAEAQRGDGSGGQYGLLELQMTSIGQRKS